MEVLFHFVFQLFKIGILSLVYYSIIMLILIVIQKVNPNLFLNQLKSKKKKYRPYLFATCYLLLLIFSFTYWGNHGLGDNPKIPIGHWKTLKNTNWTEYAYLDSHKTSEGIHIETTQFKVTDDKLCGNLKSWFYDFRNNFFILDLKTDELIEFQSETEYNQYATKNQLPKSSELLNFEENYKAHWSGIRFWLLP
ncbi:MAG: hypothetical protein CSA38_00090 [Flavobacteriales bacterium]|nr:MAG: hypothetical protein CSA38_00090 [Flavobacteriales bacterium]